MKHYILIAMLSTGGYSEKPFANLDDCLAMQRITGGQCVEQSYGINTGTDWVNPYPLLKPDGVTPRDTPAIKAFKQGWIEEMQKPEAKHVLEQDI